MVKHINVTCVSTSPLSGSNGKQCPVYLDNERTRPSLGILPPAYIKELEVFVAESSIDAQQLIAGHTVVR